ncbi:hypothetical protein [Legionella sp. km772]|uniref:hypothetical protein n=1 Tax=Legionella sp. km772 TaxID=2498111 RepID=UPI000F8E43E4|nr:hypothetical protein [Legionella sp. km772]RUR08463.1 hypothetical protein ELY15_10750 [Legionella sp. km772]
MTNKSKNQPIGFFIAKEAKKEEASFDAKWDKIKVHGNTKMKKRTNLNRFMAEEAAEARYAEEHYLADYADEDANETDDQPASLGLR